MSDVLLAGPILRRVTENRVCVWIATTQSIDIRLDIFTQSNMEVGKSNVEKLYSERTQLGENLFIYLLEARCPNTLLFPLDELLSYQLVSLNEDQTEEILDLSLLAYPGFDKPSFYIPSKIETLLHGSCRKPHGSEANDDALFQGDKVLENSCHTISQRPPLLLLTGDQIYADDVSISLSSMLRREACKLIGFTECLPVCTGTEPTSSIPLHGRKEFLKTNKSRFSSGESENHLLSFGEYAAMYIYVFGNIQNWEVETDWNTLEKEGVSDPEKAKKDFDSQLEALNRFKKTLPSIRRLLANISTYMMFDDHDVTDDWNITNMWYDEVRDSTLGRRVVANALASCWAFQSCGNDPDNYSMDFKSAISNFLQSQAPKAEVTEQYDLQMWKHRGWGFSVPTNPPIMAIDSRTQRASTPFSYLPILLDRYARDWLVVEWSKLKADRKITSQSCPIFIASTPVMGFTSIQFLQRLLLSIGTFVDKIKIVRRMERLIGKNRYFTRKIIRAADVEAWASNNKGLLALMDCLSKRMQIKQCLFLSGDVHYAFSAVGKYQKNKISLKCYQLTSSSLKNSPDERQGKHLERAGRFGDGTTRHLFWGRMRILFNFPIENLESVLPKCIMKNIWETKTHLLAAEKTNKRIVSSCNLGLVEFKEGLPIKHSLKNSCSDEVFFIPTDDHISTGR